MRMNDFKSVNKIFFLDRDGTINVDYDFVHKPEEWTFCDGAPEAIRRLNELGYKVVVVTNQSGVIRKRFTMDHVVRLHEWVDGELAKHGARIDAWYVAPWHPKMHDGLADRLLHDRKPGTGMFEKALRKFKADPLQCHMAGDKISDLDPAINLGMRAHLIKSRFYDSIDHGYLNTHHIKVYHSLKDVVDAIDTSH